MLFKDEAHKAAYSDFLRQMSSIDGYHKAAAYLLALNPDIRRNAAGVFDFCGDCIKPDALRESWQTGESLKCTRLLFNLWNGLHDDDTDGTNAELYAVDAIFSGSDADFYFQAVQIRFDRQ